MAGAAIPYARFVAWQGFTPEKIAGVELALPWSSAAKCRHDCSSTKTLLKIGQRELRAGRWLAAREPRDRSVEYLGISAVCHKQTAMCAQTSPPLDEDYVPAPGMKQRIRVLPERSF